MYVGIRSVDLNSDDFRRAVGGAMKLSRAGFGCFEGTFHLAQINDCH